MGTSKTTAEEQLLRMIEGPRGGQSPTPSASSAPVKDALRKLPEWMTRWRRRLGAIRPGRQPGDAFLRKLRLAQRLLTAVLVGLGVYVVVNLLLPPKPRLRQAAVLNTHAPAGPAASATAASSAAEAGHALRALSEYVAAVQERNPFTGTSAREEGLSLKTTKHHLEEMATGLSVVGIDRGANPVALIEDTAQHKTYIVKAGDALNGMRVKEIRDGKVLVSYEGEELVLP